MPSKREFEVLLKIAGGVSSGGKLLKSKRGWSKGNGTNEIGFYALPAGFYDRLDDLEFLFLGYGAYFWASDKYWLAIPAHSDGDSFVSSVDINYGADGEKALSVRCLKD